MNAIITGKVSKDVWGKENSYKFKYEVVVGEDGEYIKKLLEESSSLTIRFANVLRKFDDANESQTFYKGLPNGLTIEAIEALSKAGDSTVEELKSQIDALEKLLALKKR